MTLPQDPPVILCADGSAPDPTCVATQKSKLDDELRKVARQYQVEVAVAFIALSACLASVDPIGPQYPARLCYIQYEADLEKAKVKRDFWFDHARASYAWRVRNLCCGEQSPGENPYADVPDADPMPLPPIVPGADPMCARQYEAAYTATWESYYLGFEVRLAVEGYGPMSADLESYVQLFTHDFDLARRQYVQDVTANCVGGGS